MNLLPYSSADGNIRTMMGFPCGGPLFFSVNNMKNNSKGRTVDFA